MPPQPAQGLKITIFSPSKPFAYISLVADLASRMSVPLVVAKNLAELKLQASVDSGTLLIFSLRKPNELRDFLTFLTDSKPLFMSGKLRAFGSIIWTDERTERMLLKLRVAEILPEVLVGKGFVMKLNRHFESLAKSSKPTPSGNTQKVDSDAPFGRSDGEQSYQVVLEPPLTIPQDFWSIQKTRDLIGRMGMWNCEVIGPPPSQGKWVRLDASKAENPGAETDWIWSARSPGSDFDPGSKGRWKFFGRKPDYLWRSLKWRLAGSQPSLTFESSTGGFVHRFWASGQNLHAARNSQRAMELLDRIFELTQNEKEFKAGDSPDFTTDESSLSPVFGESPSDAPNDPAASTEDDEIFFDLPQFETPLASPEPTPEPVSESIPLPAPSEERLREICENVALTVSIQFGETPPIPVRLVDLFDETVVLDSDTLVPSGKCTLRINAGLATENIKIEVPAEIIEEPTPSENQGYTLTLRSKDVLPVSEPLLKILHARQEHIIEFVGTAKGDWNG